MASEGKDFYDAGLALIYLGSQPGRVMTVHNDCYRVAAPPEARGAEGDEETVKLAQQELYDALESWADDGVVGAAPDRVADAVDELIRSRLRASEPSGESEQA